MERRIGPRFSLAVPLRYRLEAEAQWHSTQTENISNEGAVFVAEKGMAQGTRLHVEIAMNADRLNPATIIAVSEVVWEKSVDGGFQIGIKHVTREMRENAGGAANAG